MVLLRTMHKILTKFLININVVNCDKKINFASTIEKECEKIYIYIYIFFFSV